MFFVLDGRDAIVVVLVADSHLKPEVLAGLMVPAEVVSHYDGLEAVGSTAFGTDQGRGVAVGRRESVLAPAVFTI
jgi:hypothetical protein